jgi:hypothetical protein
VLSLRSASFVHAKGHLFCSKFILLLSPLSLSQALLRCARDLGDLLVNCISAEATDILMLSCIYDKVSNSVCPILVGSPPFAIPNLELKLRLFRLPTVLEADRCELSGRCLDCSPNSNYIYKILALLSYFHHSRSYWQSSYSIFQHAHRKRSDESIDFVPGEFCAYYVWLGQEGKGLPEFHDINESS